MSHTTTETAQISDIRIKIRPIESLLNADKPFQFFIPKYQRGYRWSEDQVTALLKDINTFKSKAAKDSWYCLQPIVVRQREDGGENEWEVIDGQQRLTTIYLVLHYLNQCNPEFERDNLFELHYETRPGSADFLQNRLVVTAEPVVINNECTDYHYITQAFETIRRWFTDRKATVKKSTFGDDFKSSTKIIWYEANDDEPVEVFTRLNVGKIPLTNAELIKALFLNRSNQTEGKLSREPLEIAAEWDGMEYKLREESFWHFLTHNRIHKENRIEFLFDLEPDLEKGSDDYNTFRHFAEKIENPDCRVDDLWAEVKRRFQTLEEWYESHELYHKIGYLIAEKKGIKELLIANQKKAKSEFENYLDAEIGKTLKADNVDSLDYESHKGIIKSVLLLHNIHKVLKDNSTKFPFDLYVKDSWDIEHITSVMDEAPDHPNDQKKWLEAMYPFLEDMPDLDNPVGSPTLKSRAEGLIKDFRPDRFLALYNDISAHYAGSKDDETNGISNLALLNASINRGYKNAIFPFKRKEIIEQDKKGTFIPPCTRNVFLKYYNPNPDHLAFWDRKDRERYKESIAETLNYYLTAKCLAA